MTPAAEISLLVLDVDGVLTDGRIYVDDHGHERLLDDEFEGGTRLQSLV